MKEQLKNYLRQKLIAESSQDAGNDDDFGLEQSPVPPAWHKPSDVWPIWQPFDPNIGVDIWNKPWTHQDPRLNWPGLNWHDIMAHLAMQYFEQYGFWPSWWPYENAGPWPSDWDQQYFPSIG